MKLLIMPSRQGQHEAISLNVSWLVVIGCTLLVAAVAGGAALQRAVWNAQPETQPVTLAASSATVSSADKEVAYTLAAKVGALQASVARLDGLGRRVAKVAGLPDSNVTLVQDTPEAIVVLDDLLAATEVQSRPGDTADIERQINAVQASLTRQSDYLSILDLALTNQAAGLARLPTAMPLESYPYLSSSYGWRRNPFNGQMNMHEGLDFSAPTGTPIRAASGGVVRTVAVHSGYGNMVEIDHGGGLITRYAHAKVVLVKEGQLVTRGEVIARVGSTGLSTGAHLHFEVRQDDKALDPRVFLAGHAVPSPVAASSPTPVMGSVTWRPRVR